MQQEYSNDHKIICISKDDGYEYEGLDQKTGKGLCGKTIPYGDHQSWIYIDNFVDMYINQSRDDLLTTMAKYNLSVCKDCVATSEMQMLYLKNVKL